MQPRSKKKVVWVIDDNADHAELLIDTIRDESPDILVNHILSGEEALNQLLDMASKSSPLPSLIFMDIKMPRKNGIETLSDIKKRDTIKDIPIIMLSTSTNTLEINSSLQAGALLYIAKPLTSRYFAQHILPIINAQSTDNL